MQYSKKKITSGKYNGDPTETAIVKAANEKNIHKNDLEAIYPRVGEIPFDSTRKLMTTIHRTLSGYRIITKGAPDVLLSKCKKYYNNGNILELEETVINSIKKANKSMGEKALRVLGVAYLDVDKIPSNNNIENNLIFVRLNRHDRSTKRRGKRSGRKL